MSRKKQNQPAQLPSQRRWCVRHCMWPSFKETQHLGLIVHSDRGTQYASAEHQDLLAKHGLAGSMSRKGNCWDNAMMERFFLNLKTERL